MNNSNNKSLKSSLYDILEVSMSADEEEIRRAYDRIKQIYAEDSLVIYGLYSQDEIRKFREQIEQAFRILIDSENRKDYDHSLIAEPIKKRKQLQITIKPKGSSSEQSEAEENHESSDSNHGAEGEDCTTLSNSSTKDESPSTKEVPDMKLLAIEVPEEVKFTGEYLRLLREEHNIALRAISDLTKISMTNLKLLEAEEWDKLPAMVYVKGFIVQYARYLGLDSKRMLRDLEERFEQSRSYS